MHRILVRHTVQLQYGTTRFFVEEISKKLENVNEQLRSAKAENHENQREKQ